MTDLYLDTEFNGHGGELISLALASTSGRHWYAVTAPYIPRAGQDPWVADNVMPLLYKMQPTVDAASSSDDVIRFWLKEYLVSFPQPLAIYADWPADFEHLMNLMCGPTFGRSFVVPCTMHLIKGADQTPEIPHNALSDAIALMEWHQSVRRAADHGGPVWPTVFCEHCGSSL